MNTKKILLDEINKVKLLSSYNLKNTHEENKIFIFERGEGREVFRGLQDLIRADREAFTSFKSELESIVKDVKLFTEEGKELKTTEEVLKSIKEGTISAESMVNIGGQTFVRTKNAKVIDAIAEDIVRSEKFVEEYRNLTPKELETKLSQSKMKIPKGSRQMESIIKANERLINTYGFDEFRGGFREYENYRNYRDLEGPYGSYRTEAEYKRAAEEWARRYGRTFERDVKNVPLSVFEKLRDSGLLIWRGGKWIIGNALWIILFGGLAYGVWKYFSNKTGVIKDEDDNEDREPKKGTSDDLIRDEEGNFYNPCTGVYKINCVTSDSEGGLDFISQAQECLGLRITGKFNSELEQKLISKLHKPTFSKNDMKYICMAGGTLARL